MSSIDQLPSIGIEPRPIQFPTLLPNTTDKEREADMHRFYPAESLG